MKDTDLYLGTWELVPELALYEYGPRPASCTYEIACVEGCIQARLTWTTEGGEEQSASFGGPADGTPQPMPEGTPKGGPDAFSLTRVDERTLDSAALWEGEVVATARRVASADGKLLAILQVGPRPESVRFRNFQVYRRREG